MMDSALIQMQFNMLA